VDITTEDGMGMTEKLTILAGTFGVFEPAKEEWMHSEPLGIPDCTLNGQQVIFQASDFAFLFSLEPGDDLVCTFFNKPIATIQVDKEIVGYPPNQFITPIKNNAFNLFIEQIGQGVTQVQSGVVNVFNLALGVDFLVGENPPEALRDVFTPAVTGDCETPENGVLSIGELLDVEPGDDAKCTITNTFGDTGPPEVGEFACGKLVSSYANVIHGTSLNEKITGTKNNDLIFGHEGKDKIKGKGGDDCLIGGPGRDKLFGGSGDDVLKGESGGDMLKGNSGKDLLNGGKNKDTLNGGGGTDTCINDAKDNPNVSCEL